MDRPALQVYPYEIVLMNKWFVPIIHNNTGCLPFVKIVQLYIIFVWFGAVLSHDIHPIFSVDWVTNIMRQDYFVNVKDIMWRNKNVPTGLLMIQ